MSGGKSAFVGAVPTGKDWLHEIKYGGYRMHARIDGGQVKLLTCTGRLGPWMDWSLPTSFDTAGRQMDMRNHPFDWWDLLLFAMPIAAIVFAMFWEAE